MRSNNTEIKMVGIHSNEHHQAVSRILDSLTDLITPAIQVDQSASDDVIHQKIVDFLQENY